MNECSRACTSVRPCRSYDTCPVGTHPGGQSRWGVEDLAGNVWEWNQDAYAVWDQAEPEKLLTAGEEARRPRVIRGGSWRETEPYSLRSSERSNGLPGQAFFNVGFRCVQSVSSNP